AAASAGVALSRPRPCRVATIFSPLRSMKIPDTEIEPPSTHRTPEGSTPVLASASRKRRLASSVPTGPEKRARPPSRATATAALAAQPPVVATRSEARILVPGAGKVSTLNRKSSTAMPAHKTTGAARSGEFNAVLHPLPDDVVGDRDRHRR